MTNYNTGISGYLTFFTKRLRLSNPWKYKAPLLMSIPYLVLLLSSYKSKEAIVQVFASLFIIVGVAGVGYLSNDLGDRKKDKVIEKENVTSELSGSSIFFLFVFFFSLAIVPWLYLPLNAVGLFLLVLQFVLFFLYAFPPFRLKEKGLSGLIADALYAHVIPCILAAYTFCHVGKQSFTGLPLFLTILGCWQFILGVRNILLHQLKDHTNDIRSATLTFVTQFGVQRSERIVRSLILPLEILSLLIFILCFSLQAHSWHIGAACLAFWLHRTMVLKIRPTLSNYRELAYTLLDDLYILWFPMFVLLELVYFFPAFFPILILHFIVFRNGLKTWLFEKFGSVVRSITN